MSASNTSLSDIWNKFLSGVGEAVQDKAADTVSVLVNTGLQQLQQINQPAVTNAPRPTGFLEQLQSVLKTGVSGSDLGTAANFSAILRSPWVMIGGAVLLIAIVARVVRR